MDRRDFLKSSGMLGALATVANAPLYQIIEGVVPRVFNSIDDIQSNEDCQAFMMGRGVWDAMEFFSSNAPHSAALTLEDLINRFAPMREVILFITNHKSPKNIMEKISDDKYPTVWDAYMEIRKTLA